MAALIPFRALRPEPATAARVAAVPYDVVSTDEARALAADQPLSFLHVSRAEIDLPPTIDHYAPDVYARAAENFRRLRESAPLVVESRPSLYVYRLAMGAHVQTGVAGGFSLDEYAQDLIRKHERTRRDKEDDRTRHILELRAQTGPVFLTYRASADVDATVSRVMAAPPLFDFVADDGVTHTVWLVPEADERLLVDAFAAIPALYIADGHHRAASAARARQHLRGPSGQAGEWDSVLAVAFPDAQMQVLPYNRVVRDLNGHTPQGFLDVLGRVLSIDDGAPAPAGRGRVGMYLAGRWHTLHLPPAPAGASAADRLDVSVLQDIVLTPVLGIGDVRSDTRIDFVGGARGTRELERLVSSGTAAVAFALFPVDVDDLMQISDAGGIMPPKSTWFEPKLRDGLLSHTI